MSILFSNRITNLVIVLLHLAAVLLPVPAAAAPAAAVPALVEEAVCGGTNAAAAPLQVASADQQVQIPDVTLDAAIFEANARQALQDVDLAQAVIMSELIIQLRNSGFSGDIEQVMDEYELALAAMPAVQGAAAGESAGSAGYDSFVHKMLNVALDSQVLKRHVSAVWKRLNGQPDRLAQLGSISRQVIDSTLRYSMHTRIAGRMAQSFRGARDCAAGNPAAARAFDKHAGKKLGVSITDNAKTMVKKRPALAVPPQIIQLIESNNSINLSLNDLRGMTRVEFEKVHGAMADMQKTLVQIDARQQVVVDYINNQQLQQEMQALAAAKAAQHQLTLDAFRSSISILSTLTGVLSPQLAQQVAVIGDSALQIGESLHGWLSAVSGLDTLTDVASLSTVIMTGNVLGAVMNVVSLFGDKGPTPDQMILEEIGKLRQEVNQLRTEMHDRFDRIDAELNAIYTTMQERFDLIDIQLGKINGRLDAIQETLLALDLRLSRLERNTFELIDAVGRRPLLAAINGGLGYQARTGLPMPYEPQFVEFENALHTWGTLHAFDALAIGPSQRDYSAGALLRELNTYPMDANLNYLNGWLLANGLPGIADKVVASPRDWMLAARAYSQLGSEWPGHMQRISPARQAQLDAIGADVESALFNIAALPTVGAAGSRGNELLFTQVISYYEGTLDRLDGGIQPIEVAYLAEVQNQELKRAEPFDLYAGIDQPLTYLSPGIQSLTYDDSANTLAVPNNLKVQIPGFNRYNLAEYFAISSTPQIAVSMVSFLLNGRSVPGCTPDPDVCPVIGDLQVQVGAYYGTAPLALMEFNAGRVTLPVVRGDIEDPTSYAARNWGNLKPRFEQGAGVVEPTPDQAARRAQLYATLGIALENRLATYQQRLYGRVLNELNVGSLQQRAVEVAGGKALLDNIVTLGLPNAVNSDDFLHAMLYGSQRLVDDSQIVQSYALSATLPVTGTQLLVNPRLVLNQVADRRSVAFGQIVDKYLDAITADTYAETLDSVAGTRRDLALTMRITQLGEGAAPAASRLYLPVIAR